MMMMMIIITAPLRGLLFSFFGWSLEVMVFRQWWETMFSLIFFFYIDFLFFLIPLCLPKNQTVVCIMFFFCFDVIICKLYTFFMVNRCYLPFFYFFILFFLCFFLGHVNCTLWYTEDKALTFSSPEDDILDRSQGFIFLISRIDMKNIALDEYPCLL